MSYILDALRRAEAERERERGAVPGLHSQPAPVLPPTPLRRSTGAGPWIAAGTGGALLLAVLGWWLLTRGDTKPGTTVAPAAAPAPAAPVAAAAPPAPVVIVVPSPAPAPAPVPVPAATPTPIPMPAPAVAARPPAPAPAPARVLPYEQLPEDVKRQLPVLAVGGAIHSDNAASRMLIVGGQLLHEGDNVVPGIVLEQIRQRSAVLRKGELRYEISF